MYPIRFRSALVSVLSSALAAALLLAPSALAAGAGDASDVAASVRSSMDPSADPCVDFHRYACGGWLDTTELPADESRWSRSFSVVGERNREILRALVEKAASDPGDDPDRRRIGGFYTACMDEARIETLGADALAPLLEKVDAVEDLAGFFGTAAALQRDGVTTLFDVGVLPDFKDPERNIGFLSQGGLGLPDRDYYLSEDPARQALRTAYRDLVVEMLRLLGRSEEAAGADADRILAFETALAEASRTRQDMRKVDELYNKLDLKGLVALTPELPWAGYFQRLGHPGFEEINVAVPEFFEGLQKAALAAGPETWRAYLRWQVARDLAPHLSTPFVDAHFAFFGRQLSGQQEIQPRWKRCVDETQDAMGEVLGRLFVAEHFAGDSKEIASTMIRDIEHAFAENLASLSWMDDATRKRALEKSGAVANKIGYPDAWKDYSALAIDPNDHLGNVRRATAVELDRQMAKHGQPVDENEWFISPQTVNAYYNPLGNEMVFPAGILQPPFFHRSFPAAMNYGGIGSAMGHELTHGFDDSGRKFDPEGQLREWWEPEVSARFEERAACIEERYSAFEIEPGLHLNGTLTLGENIADVGGVKQAFRGYREWVERNGEPEPFVEGLTGDQLFFVAFAQNWCAHVSPERARLLATTDSHSLPRFRILGALPHVPAFAATFSCESGQPMAAKNRCEVW